MKLIKVLFLFLFFISFKSYVSQGTYVLTESQGTPPALSGDLFMSQYNNPGQNIQCKDSLDGRLKIENVTGPGIFTYQWRDEFGLPIKTTTTFESSDSLVNIGEATYQLLVSNSITSDVLFYNVSLSSRGNVFLLPMGIGGSKITPPDCYEDLSASLDSNGSIKVVAFGGVGTKSYQWDDPSTTLNSQVNNLGPGFYTVIVNDINGCADTATHEVVRPDQLYSNAIVTSEGCLGQNNAELTSLPSGGSGGYSYLWTPPTGPTQSNATATNLPAASPNPVPYTLAVNDSKGCKTIPGDTTILLTVPTPPTITGTLNACIGSTTLLAGSVPLGGSTWASASQGVATIDGNGSVLGISAGTSVITYTDGNGCDVTATVTINALDDASFS